MRRSSLVGLLILILIIIGIVVAAANNSNSNSQSTASPNATNTTNANQSASTSTVDIRNMMFTPSQVTIHKGDTVTWTNKDTIAHTVTDDLANAGGPDSGDIQPGTSYSFTFKKSGSFQYHCSIHHSMRGTIVVR